MVTITIDAMGGDHGLSTTVPGALMALSRHPELSLILVGDADQIQAALSRHKGVGHPRLSIRHASEKVSMDESPVTALRNKKDSSLRVSIDLVKDGEASACVSAGNTGALMATARFVLRMLPGIDRLAIVYAMPSLNFETGQMASVYMLDLGANVDCLPEHLFQFALMGSILADNHSHGEGRPRVALLNVGSEEIKGHETVKRAAELIGVCEDIHYIGYVEGDDIFQAKADVIVCDGFTGNIVLKATEGAAKFFSSIIKKAFKRNWLTRICAIFAMPALLQVKQELDLEKYNGASFLGLNGIVVKSHGSASAKAFATAISEALNEVERDVLAQIRAQLGKLLPADEDVDSGASEATESGDEQTES